SAHAGDRLVETASLGSGCYLLYTSGSTGRPKGVLVEHHALATYLDFLSTVFDFGPGDRMLQFSSLVFDLAEGEIFTALSQGATLVFVPPEAMVSPEELAVLIRRERVTYMGAPPALIGLLDPEGYPDLRGMLVGGEAFSGDLVNRWNRPGRLFLNAYGPTEATIGCTYHPCEHREWTASPPIGRAMPHRRVYLVDRWFNPVPVGVPGEILAAGEGLARGYLHRAGLTAEKFIPDPFGRGRAYRTGDLAYWTEDGQIQFLGRIDTQIKLRGQRIELEEIEAVLERHPGVRRAVVALREDTPAGQGLVAYVIGGDDEPPSPRELRDYVSAALPGYMVPVAYVGVLGLPLSPTGKVNRAALPAPEPDDFVSADYVAPRTGVEEQVAGAFAEVLGAGRVGAMDSFFDLGGSSLQAALALSRIRDHTGVALPMRHFYSQPTVQAVAAAVASFRAGGGGDGGVIVPLKAGGTRRPLYCVHNVSGSAYTYLPLAQRLPDEQPLFAFQSPALEGGVAPADLVTLAAGYVAALRAQQPHGPYRLAGHSMGGTIAYQMACALAEAGERVEPLVLFDTQPPQPRPDGGWPEILQLFADDLAGVAGVPAPRLDPRWTSEPDPEWLVAELRRAGVVPIDTGPGFVADRLPAFAANVRAQWGYRPPAGGFDGRLVLVRAARSANTGQRWRGLCAELDVRVAPGDHYSIWEPANLPALVGILRGCLD
ncbi:MAG TPA: amino acid adenylation domain-containing protein, partial [Mycobacteriales bacterium]|nr:amino acid adenylation domain-containing protein [Mycobacteriales bacterium]